MSRDYPPLRDPILEDSEDDSLDWYYGDHAGGMVLNFGKHEGTELHAVCLNYLSWWYEKARDRKHPTLKAIRVYLEGLEEHAKENYLDFIVPIGKKHGGQTIGECRDKKWMNWTFGQPKLRSMFPYYFLALSYHLRNPQHFNHTQDIDELLNATEYADDLDLRDEEEHYDTDLGDLVVSDGHAESDSGAKNDLDSDEGSVEGMTVRSRGGKITQAKESRSSPVVYKGKGTPKKPPKKPPRKITDSDDGFLVSDDNVSFESSSSEADTEVVSIVSTLRRRTRSSQALLTQARQAAPESDSNKSASEEDSDAISSPKGRNSNNTRDRYIFSHVQIPESPYSKPYRAKAIVDSEDEAPPMVKFPQPRVTRRAQALQRQTTPPSDSEEEVESEVDSEHITSLPTSRKGKKPFRKAPKALSESEEDDFGDNVQSPGPSVPATPRRRRRMTDDEDEEELTSTKRHRRKLVIDSEDEAHSEPRRPKKGGSSSKPTTPQNNEATTSKRRLRGNASEDSDEETKPSPKRKRSSIARSHGETRLIGSPARPLKARNSRIV